VIIMTSNVGARDLFEKKRLGFNDSSDAEKNAEHVKSNLISELKRLFKPEFLNRVDDIIIFHTLGNDEIKQIAVKMLDNLKIRMANAGITVSFGGAILDMLAKAGFDPAYGARPLRRAIQNKIEDFAAEQMLGGKIKDGDSILLDYENDKVTVTKQTAE